MASCIWQSISLIFFWTTFFVRINQHDCMNVRQSGFPVFAVDSCPGNLSEVETATLRLNCSDVKEFRNVYHCIPDSKLSLLVEFCYDGISGLIERGNCMVLENQHLNNRPCKQFTTGCPDAPYFAKNMFNYPACTQVSKQNSCYLADPRCPNISFIEATTTPTVNATGNITTLIIILSAVGFLLLLGSIVFVILWTRRRHQSHKRKKDPPKDQTETFLLMAKEGIPTIEGNDPTNEELPILKVQRASSGVEGVIIYYSYDVRNGSSEVHSIKWTKDGHPLDRSTQKYSGGDLGNTYLKIYHPTEDDIGEYTCEISNNRGSVKESIHLISPVVTIAEERVVTIGSPATIEAHVNSCPSLEKVIWQKSMDTNSESFQDININDSKYCGTNGDQAYPRLVIPNTNYDDRQYYRLLVCNGIVQRTSNMALLKVVGDPPSLSSYPETNVSEKSIRLVCEVTVSPSSPKVMYVFWTKNEIEIDIPRSGGKYSGGNIDNPSLLIKDVNQRDAGLYQCSASNAAGIMRSETIYLGPPKVTLSSYEDKENNKVIYEATITSTPVAIKAEWKVKNCVNDDFQPIDIYHPTYKGSTTSLPIPRLIVDTYKANLFGSFQIEVQNFIDTAIKHIKEQQTDLDIKMKGKEIEPLRSFYKKNGSSVRYSKLSNQVVEAFSDKVKKLKDMLLNLGDIDADSINAAETSAECVKLIKEKNLFNTRDVIYMQFLLKETGCNDVYEKCINYAKQETALCFYETPPVNGCIQPKFHVCGNLMEYNKEDIDCIKQTVADIVDCKADEIQIAGFHHSQSFFLILSIKERYSKDLIALNQHQCERLWKLKVDYFVVGDKKICTKGTRSNEVGLPSHLQQNNFSQLTSEELPVYSLHEISHADSTGLSEIWLKAEQKTHKDGKEDLRRGDESELKTNKLTFSLSAEPEVSAASFPSDNTYTQPALPFTSGVTAIQEGESCIGINRKQSEGKSLEMEQIITKRNSTSQTALLDSQEQKAQPQFRRSKTLNSKVLQKVSSYETITEENVKECKYKQSNSKLDQTVEKQEEISDYDEEVTFELGKCTECVKAIPAFSSDEMEAGDHVIFRRGMYSHHCIIISTLKDGMTFEIMEATNTFFGISKLFAGKARINSTFKRFDFENENVNLVDYRIRRYSKRETIERAKYIYDGKEEYDLLNNNCEHFATFCVTGKCFSVKVPTFKMSKWILSKRLGIINELTKNEIEFENNIICRDCYEMNKALFDVTLKPIVKEQDVEVGDIIRYQYYSALHDAVILEKNRTTKESVMCCVAHYAFCGHFSHREIKKEEVEIHLNGKCSKLEYIEPRYEVYNPVEVVKRARKRLGEKMFAIFSNDSSHFARWCKLKKNRCLQRNISMMQLKSYSCIV